MKIKILKYSAFIIPIILIFLVGFFILKNEKKEVRIENNLQETKFFYMSPRGEKLTQKFAKETTDNQKEITIFQ